MSDYKLKQEMCAQSDQIRKLSSRLSQMADQNKALENDIAAFKTRVSKDILDIVEYLKKQKK